MNKITIINIGLFLFLSCSNTSFGMKTFSQNNAQLLIVKKDGNIFDPITGQKKKFLPEKQTLLVGKAFEADSEFVISIPQIDTFRVEFPLTQQIAQLTENGIYYRSEKPYKNGIITINDLPNNTLAVFISEGTNSTGYALVDRNNYFITIPNDASESTVPETSSKFAFLKALQTKIGGFYKQCTFKNIRWAGQQLYNNVSVFKVGLGVIFLYLASLVHPSYVARIGQNNHNEHIDYCV